MHFYICVFIYARCYLLYYFNFTSYIFVQMISAHFYLWTALKYNLSAGKIPAMIEKLAGLVFTKGLTLSQVLGLNVVLKLRLLSQLSFVLKPYSQRVT